MRRAPMQARGKTHPSWPETPCRDIRHRRPSDTPKGDRHANHRIPQQRTGTPTYHEREREMSHPDPRPLAEANGAYPYELPVHDSAITGAGTEMPGADTPQHQEEWHHADPPPRGAGGWDATREFGPPLDGTDEGVL